MNTHTSQATPSDQWHILIVSSLVESADHTQVFFLGGKSVSVPKDHPDWQTIHQWLSLSLRRGCPIAVRFDEGDQLAQVGMLDRNEVSEMGEDPRSPHLLQVKLRGNPAPHFLSRNHPRYQALLNHVTQALATRQSLWWIVQGSSIVDIKRFTQEEEEALSQWIQQHGQGTGE